MSCQFNWAKQSKVFKRLRTISFSYLRFAAIKRYSLLEAVVLNRMNQTQNLKKILIFKHEPNQTGGKLNTFVPNPELGSIFLTFLNQNPNLNPKLEPKKPGSGCKNLGLSLQKPLNSTRKQKPIKNPKLKTANQDLNPKPFSRVPWTWGGTWILFSRIVWTEP